jgi:uncharacterized membrane protein (UPF0127 family)
MARRIVTVTRPDGTAVCESCRLAATFASRLRGLLGAKQLESGHGILIRPATSVHTFFMRFAIDVVFLDRGGSVVKLVPNLRPWRVAFGRGARETLELPAGEAGARGIQVGERLVLAPEPGVA